MPRLLFEKTGNAIWMSHLDLMRMFQRAFKRANLPLKHTQGFNPRPSVSIALPLSVGVASRCELLDFDLEGDRVSCENIRILLNRNLVNGVQVLDVYEGGRKIGDLAFLRCRVDLHYDRQVPADGIESIRSLFLRDSLVVEKKTKSGMQDQDIIPMIQTLEIMQTVEGTVRMDALICCQNPTLNPSQLSLAICKHLPEMAPDFSKCVRLEIYDKGKMIFR